VSAFLQIIQIITTKLVYMRSVGSLIGQFVCTNKPFRISRWKAVCKIEEAWRFRLWRMCSKRVKRWEWSYCHGLCTYCFYVRMGIYCLLYIYIHNGYLCITYLCMYMQ